MCCANVANLLLARRRGARAGAGRAVGARRRPAAHRRAAADREPGAGRRSAACSAPLSVRRFWRRPRVPSRRAAPEAVALDSTRAWSRSARVDARWSSACCSASRRRGRRRTSRWRRRWPPTGGHPPAGAAGCAAAGGRAGRGGRAGAVRRGSAAADGSGPGRFLLRLARPAIGADDGRHVDARPNGRAATRARVQLAFYAAVEREVGGAAGVRGVAWAATLPLGDGPGRAAAVPNRAETGPARGRAAARRYQLVSPSYFATVDLPIVRAVRSPASTRRGAIRCASSAKPSSAGTSAAAVRSVSESPSGASATPRLAARRPASRSG